MSESSLIPAADVTPLDTNGGTEETFACTYCANTFLSSVDQLKHERGHKLSPMRFYKCDLCAEKFPKKILLVQHKRTHTANGDDDETASNIQLAQHKKTHATTSDDGDDEPTPKVQLPQSKKTHAATSDGDEATPKIQLPQDKKTHAANSGGDEATPKIQQAQDKKTDSTNDDDDDEATNKTTAAKIQCDICFKEFSRKDHVKRHKDNIHLGIKPPKSERVCNICSKEFSTVSHLRYHKKRFHEGEDAESDTKGETTDGDAEDGDKGAGAMTDEDDGEKPEENGDDTKAETSNGNDDKRAKAGASTQNDDTGAKTSSDNTDGAATKVSACKLCSKQFTRDGNLRRHMARKHSIVPETGASSGNDKDESTDAESDKNGTEENKCKVCDKTFSKAGNLKRHVVMTHSATKKSEKNDSGATNKTNKMHGCKICSMYFSHQNALDQHTADIHPKEEKMTFYKCDRCPVKYRKLEELNIHQQKAHPMFKCDLCSVKFKHSMQLVDHKKVVHSVEDHKCHRCAKVFSKAELLTEHKMSAHRGVGKPMQHKCKKCVMIFSTPELLKEHEVTHKTVLILARHKCNICAKEFRQSGYLMFHMKKIHGIAPTVEGYKCDLCAEKFVKCIELERHERNSHVMDDDKAKKVSEAEVSEAKKVPEAKKVSEAKKVPEAKKVSEAKKVPEAKKVSEAKKVPEQAVIKKTQGDKKAMYRCDQCPKEYESPQTLKNHQQRFHTKKDEFACKGCEKSFARLASLKRHCKDAHGESWQGEAASSPVRQKGKGEAVKAASSPKRQKVKGEAVKATSSPKRQKVQGEPVEAAQSPKRQKVQRDSVQAVQSPKRRKVQSDPVKAASSPMRQKVQEESEKATRSPKRQRVIFKCERCAEEFGRRDKLEEHECAGSGEEKATEDATTCNMCSMEFGTSEELKIHKRYVHKVIMESTPMKRSRKDADDLQKQERENDHGVKKKRRDCDDDSDSQNSSANETGKSGNENEAQEASESVGRENNTGPGTQEDDSDEGDLTGIRGNTKAALTCKLCLVVFSDSNLLNDHMQIVHELKQAEVLECDLCHKKFRHSSYLSHHKQNIHNIKPPVEVYACDLCPEEFKQSRLLKQHRIKVHSVKDRVHQCKVCSKEFRREGNLIRHMKEAHAKTAKNEDHSKTTTKEDHSKKNMSMDGPHAQQAVPKKTFARKKSSLSKLSSFNRASHKKGRPATSGSSSDSKPHKCQYCGRGHVTITLKLRHEITHTDLKPFACQFCEYTCNRSDRLYMHKRMNHPEKLPVDERTKKVHRCKICRKAFTMECWYDKHMSVFHPGMGSTKKQVYHCEKCKAGFKTESKLEEHQKRCGIEDLPECVECDKTFQTQHGFVMHNRHKHPKIVHECDKCRGTFGTKAELDKHVTECRAGVDKKTESKRDEHQKTSEDIPECVKCRETFETKHELKMHNRHWHPKRLHECDKCRGIFGAKAELDKHVTECRAGVVLNDGVFTCDTCDLELTELVELDEHKWECDIEDFEDNQRNYILESGCDYKIKCFTCHKGMPSEKAREEHQPSCRPEVCNVCRQMFHTKYGLEEHKELNNHFGNDIKKTKSKRDEHLRTDLGDEHQKTPEDFPECVKCDKTFETKHGLKMHNRHWHPKRLHECDKCRGMFGAKAELDKHVTECRAGVVLNDGVFTCDTCDLELTELVELDEHKWECDFEGNKCNLSWYICDNEIDCITTEYATSEKNKFVRHLRACKPEAVLRFFACYKCDKGMPSEKARDEHTPSCRPEVCNVCSQMFHTKYGLEEHVQLNNHFDDDSESDVDEQKYRCNKCSKTFSLQAEYDEHTANCPEKSPSESKPYACQYCEYKCSKMDKLQMHVKLRHSDREPAKKRAYRCDKCDKDFTSEVWYEKHMTAFHHDSLVASAEPYYCEKCNGDFATEGAFDKHSLTCRSEDVPTCVECDKTFRSPKGLKSHISIKHPKSTDKDQKVTATTDVDKLYCEKCNKDFTLLSDLDKHILICQSGDIPTCEECNKTFQSIRGLKSHRTQIHPESKAAMDIVGSDEDQIVTASLIRQSDDKPTCLECNKTFQSLRGLKSHRTQMHPASEAAIDTIGSDEDQIVTANLIGQSDDIPTCTQCNKTFQSLRGLKSHRTTMHTESKAAMETIESDNNNKEVTRKTDVNDNRKEASPSKDTVAKERVLKCEVCGECFATLGQLVKHKVIHTNQDGDDDEDDDDGDGGDGSHQCKTCGKSFDKLPYLRRHETIHVDGRPFKCKDCPLSYKNMNGLQQHRAVHSGKVYKCGVCKRMFARKISLRKHKQRRVPCTRFVVPPPRRESDNEPGASVSDSGDKDGRPFKCKDCPLSYKNMNGLKQHRAVHSGRIYKCGVCKRVFARKISLKKHKQQRVPCTRFIFPPPRRESDDKPGASVSDGGDRNTEAVSGSMIQDQSTDVMDSSATSEMETEPTDESSTSDNQGVVKYEEIFVRPAVRRGRKDRHIPDKTVVRKVKPVEETDTTSDEQSQQGAVFARPQRRVRKTRPINYAKMAGGEMDFDEDVSSSDTDAQGCQSWGPTVINRVRDRCPSCQKMFVDPVVLRNHKAQCGVMHVTNKSSLLANSLFGVKDLLGMGKSAKESVYKCNDCEETFEDIITLGVHSCSRGDENQESLEMAHPGACEKGGPGSLEEMDADFEETDASDGDEIGKKMEDGKNLEDVGEEEEEEEEEVDAGSEDEHTGVTTVDESKETDNDEGMSEDGINEEDRDTKKLHGSGVEEKMNQSEAAIDHDEKSSNSSEIEKKSDNKDGSITCQLCPTVFSTQVSLQSHLVTSHLKKSESKAASSTSHDCAVCRKSYDTFAECLTHESSHSGDPDVIIGQEPHSNQGANLESDPCQDVSLESNPCQDVSLKSQQDADPAAQSSSSDAGYTCTHCKKSFTKFSECFDHEKSHQTKYKKIPEETNLPEEKRLPSAFTCGYCTMYCETKLSLMTHMDESHNDSEDEKDDMSYRCSQCHKRFTCLADCWKHEQGHGGTDDGQGESSVEGDRSGSIWITDSSDKDMSQGEGSDTKGNRTRVPEGAVGQRSRKQQPAVRKYSDPASLSSHQSSPGQKQNSFVELLSRRTPDKDSLDFDVVSPGRSDLVQTPQSGSGQRSGCSDKRRRSGKKSSVKELFSRLTPEKSALDFEVVSPSGSDASSTRTRTGRTVVTPQRYREYVPESEGDASDGDEIGKKMEDGKNLEDVGEEAEEEEEMKEETVEEEKETLEDEEERGKEEEMDKMEHGMEGVKEVAEEEDQERGKKERMDKIDQKMNKEETADKMQQNHGNQQMMTSKPETSGVQKRKQRGFSKIRRGRTGRTGKVVVKREGLRCRATSKLPYKVKRAYRHAVNRRDESVAVESVEEVDEDQVDEGDVEEPRQRGIPALSQGNSGEADSCRTGRPEKVQIAVREGLRHRKPTQLSKQKDAKNPKRGRPRMTTKQYSRTQVYKHIVKAAVKCSTGQPSLQGNHSFKCSLCPTVFKGQLSLNKHQRVHTRDCEYKCMKCTASYNVLAHLRSHHRVHTGRFLKCMYCPKVSIWEDGIVRHVASKHPEHVTTV